MCQINVVLLQPKSERMYNTTSSGKAEGATLGSDSGGIAGRKTHKRNGAFKDAITFTDFG